MEADKTWINMLLLERYHQHASQKTLQSTEKAKNWLSKLYLMDINF